MAFKDIEILLTLAEELHFGRTARRLHLSQARISQSIKTQERRFGAALVDRSSYRNMQLTALGEQLVADLRPAYQRIVDALDSAQRAAQGVRGTIRVGFVSAMASEDIARIIAGFTRRRPGWTVSMRQVQPCDPAAVLASGSVDVALLRVPFPKQRQFSSMPLLTEERWVMLPERHKLAAGDRIPFDALRDEPFIALPPEAGPAREFWLATDERQGDPVKLSNLLASRPEEFCLAVANGYGVCLTPESAHRFYPYPGVAYRPVDGIAPSLVSVVWRPDESEQIVNDFVDSCAELRQ